jgi:hypothetical protein
MIKKSLATCSILSILFVSACSNTNSGEMPSQMSSKEEKLIETCENITKDNKKDVKKCVNYHIESANVEDVVKLVEYVPVEEWNKNEQLIYEQSMKMVQATEATAQSNFEESLSIYTEVKNNKKYLDNIRTLAEKEMGIINKRFESTKDVQARIDDIRQLIDEKKIDEAKAKLEPMLFELSGDPVLEKEHAQVEAMLEEIK